MVKKYFYTQNGGEKKAAFSWRKIDTVITP
jgi:hypothetical protein